jgi:hypothetical protein
VEEVEVAENKERRKDDPSGFSKSLFRCRNQLFPESDIR